MKNKVFLYLTVGIILSSLDAISQNFEYSNFNLVNATFSGGNLPIRADETASFYGVPQWVNGEADEMQIPVAYVSGNAPRVMANFSLECEATLDSIWVRGVAANGMEFPDRKVNLNSVGDGTHTFQYPSSFATTIFEAGVVDFYKPFTIGWDISADNGATWKNVDSSKNTLYVTRSAPQAEVGHFKYYRSVYDISCRNAIGNSTDTDVIAAIWTEFTDQVTLNYKGDSLFYYKTMNTSNTNLGALLAAKNAQCYTFAQLWLATIKIQGIIRTNNYVYITPVYSTTCGGYSVNRFIVKDWTFGAPTGSGCPSYPYQNTYTSLWAFPFTSYNFDTEDVSDQDGIPGQNNSNPSSYFNNHQISLIDGVYYDACYGVSFDNFEDIPVEAFSGWGYRYSSGGVTVARFTNDIGATSLSQSISTF